MWRTPDIWKTFLSCPIFKSLPGRSVTKSSPLGKNATSQGISRFSATTSISGLSAWVISVVFTPSCTLIGPESLVGPGDGFFKTAKTARTTTNTPTTKRYFLSMIVIISVSRKPFPLRRNDWSIICRVYYKNVQKFERFRFYHNNIAGGGNRYRFLFYPGPKKRGRYSGCNEFKRSYKKNRFNTNADSV